MHVFKTGVQFILVHVLCESRWVAFTPDTAPQRNTTRDSAGAVLHRMRRERYLNRLFYYDDCNTKCDAISNVCCMFLYRARAARHKITSSSKWL